MDLKSFQNGRHHTSKDENNINKDALRNTAESYMGKKDDELLAEILQAAAKGKRDGTITDEGLRSFAENVAPMLNDEQRARLQKVLNMIDRS